MLVCLGPAGEDDVVPVLARLRRETRVFGDLRLPPSTMKMLLAISIDRSDSFRDRWRRKKKIDLKREALLPIANIARWAALSVGASALHTQERLQAAAGSRMMTAEDADTLADVFEIVQHVRLRHQLEQLEADPVGHDEAARHVDDRGECPGRGGQGDPRDPTPDGQQGEVRPGPPGLTRAPRGQERLGTRPTSRHCTRKTWPVSAPSMDRT